jgi:hypothetical protein
MYRKSYEKLRVVVRGGAASARASAFFTFVIYNKAFFRIRLARRRNEKPAAVVLSVAGVYVDVERAKANITVIS